jgi:hypothetical protein
MASPAGRAVRPGMRFFTSSLVINETVTLLQRRGFHSAVLEFLRQTRANEGLEIIFLTPRCNRTAGICSKMGWDWCERRGLRKFAISEALRHAQGVHLDDHFRAPGFEI